MQVNQLAHNFFKKQFSAAGVSYIVTPKSKARRILWAFLIFATIGMMIYESYNIVSQFLTYPTMLEREEKYMRKLHFPAVTICPLQNVQNEYIEKTKLKTLSDLIHLLRHNSMPDTVSSVNRRVCDMNPLCQLDWFTDNCSCATSFCDTEFCEPTGGSECLCSPIFCNRSAPSGACKSIFKGYFTDSKETHECKCTSHHRPEESMPQRRSHRNLKDAIDQIRDPEVQKLAELLASDTSDLTALEEELLPTIMDTYNYGPSYEQIVTSCSFEGRMCGKSNFTNFYDPYFGKCFMFNYRSSSGGPYEHILDTNNYGSMSGLQVVLNVLNHSTENLYPREVGVRVTIHDPLKLPLVREDGINVDVKSNTGFQVLKSRFLHLAEPYGICTDVGTSETLEYYTNVPYDQLTCHKSYLSYHVLKECHCVKRSLAIGGLTWNDIKYKYPTCSSRNTNDVMCVSKVLEKLEKSDICGCVKGCKTVIYSTSKHEASTTHKYFYSSARQIRSLRIVDGKIVSNPLEFLTSTTLKVYFKALKVTTYTEVPCCTWDSLIAKIAGNMGFFMGLSVVTFLELGQFLWDVLMSIFCNRQKIRIDRFDNEQHWRKRRSESFITRRY